jgi:hypothetical protein
MLELCVQEDVADIRVVEGLPVRQVFGFDIPGDVETQLPGLAEPEGTEQIDDRCGVFSPCSSKPRTSRRTWWSPTVAASRVKLRNVRSLSVTSTADPIVPPIINEKAVILAVIHLCAAPFIAPPFIAHVPGNDWFGRPICRNGRRMLCCAGRNCQGQRGRLDEATEQFRTALHDPNLAQAKQNFSFIMRQKMKAE